MTWLTSLLGKLIDADPEELSLEQDQRATISITRESGMQEGRSKHAAKTGMQARPQAEGTKAKEPNKARKVPIVMLLAWRMLLKHG